MFGGVDQVKENYRDKRGLPLIDSISQDVRYALRIMAKTPMFTFITVLTLGIAIGANTAVFSVINAMMLKNLQVGFLHVEPRLSIQ